MYFSPPYLQVLTGRYDEQQQWMQAADDAG
jgi:hypothetical protein